MLQCDVQSVLIAVVLFVVPYELLVVSAGLLMPAGSLGFMQSAFVYAALPLSVALIGVGYLAARLAGMSGVANGAAVGLILSVALLLGPYLTLNLNFHFSEYIQQFGPHALVMGTFWCSLGGLIREITTY